jgi:hypothetical protein
MTYRLPTIHEPAVDTSRNVVGAPIPAADGSALTDVPLYALRNDNLLYRDSLSARVSHGDIPGDRTGRDHPLND